VLVLECAPQALALAHALLSAAGVAHECSAPFKGECGGGSSRISGSPWLHAQLAVSCFQTAKAPATLLAPLAACAGRGGLLPSAALCW
jgi:hypothetical protein